MHLALMRPERSRTRRGPRVQDGDTVVSATPSRTSQHTPTEGRIVGSQHPQSGSLLRSRIAR